MSNVLSFSDAPRVVTASRRRPGEGECEVVIFPGVRRERRDSFDQVPLDPVTRKAGKKR